MREKVKRSVKASPGPWMYDAIGGGEGEAWVLDGDGNYLFTVVAGDSAGKFVKSFARREANGELAAAAPELLAVVKEFLAHPAGVGTTAWAHAKALVEGL